MRTVTNHPASNLVLVLLLAVVFFAIVGLKPQQKLLYPVVRSIAQSKINYETRDMLAYQTPNFIIKYTEQDQNIVGMVAQAAEASYEPVGNALGYYPQGKTTIVIYPDRQKMEHSIGSQGSQNAMGLYWGGVIEVLSPSVWMKDQVGTEKYMQTGPVLHEYTHLVFDYVTDGNYPRWFTEGLAQYMEYRVNGYEWSSRQNRLDQPLYSMQTLDHNFDEVDNQALAYRESLAAVRYISDVHGENKLKEVISLLQSGSSMQKAIQSALGISYDQYEQAWKDWAITHMKNAD